MKLAIAVLLLALATAGAAAQSPPVPLARDSVTGAGYVFKPDPQDYYPETSRELNEQGLTKVKLCYDLQGKPVEVTVDQSSGFTRLDEAAVRYGQAIRIKPGSINGEPLAGCVTVPVRFAPYRSAAPSDQGGELPLPRVPTPPILRDIPLPPPPVEIIPIPLAPSSPGRSIAL